jgi:hypothetical protein
LTQELLFLQSPAMASENILDASLG